MQLHAHTEVHLYVIINHEVTQAANLLHGSYLAMEIKECLNENI